MRRLLATGSIIVLLAACSGGDGDDGTRVATTDRPATTTPDATTADATAAGATAADDTAASPVPEGCEAASGPITPDGLLTACSANGLRFGLPLDEVMSAAVEMFGPLEFDSTEEYPEPTGDGRFTDDLGAYEFAHPLGYSGCFANSLCLTFGGADEADLRLVGWQLLGGSVTDIDLATASGVTLGSSWADHLDEIVPEAGCEWTAVAAHEGMHVFLLSSDEFFGTAGVLAEELPDPTTVKVDGAYAGEISIPTDGFC